jgi:hypothetical protein
MSFKAMVSKYVFSFFWHEKRNMKIVSKKIKAKNYIFPGS